VDRVPSLPKNRSMEEGRLVDLAPALREWHDFYMLGGTAAATLIGLMFVATSIGATFFEEKYAAGMRLFLTPTVVHFGSVVILSLVVTVPSQTWASLGMLLLAGGLIGLGYSSWVAIDMRRRHFDQVDAIDRIWYALTPMAGYLVMIMAAAGLLAHRYGALEILAAALGMMLLLGIRNAWDMTIWIVLKVPNR
jgi:hypothetical protein